MPCCCHLGQRRSDIVHLGRQHIRDGMLQIRQKKTGAELAIPIHPELQVMISNTTDRLTFLVNELGIAFTVGSFSNWFRAACDMANLHHCSAHGLRKAAARRLAEAGCTVHEIAAITGHASLREIVRYTRAADQRRLATAAMDKAKAGKGIGKLAGPFAKQGEKPSEMKARKAKSKSRSDSHFATGILKSAPNHHEPTGRP